MPSVGESACLDLRLVSADFYSCVSGNTGLAHVWKLYFTHSLASAAEGSHMLGWNPVFPMGGFCK